MKTFADLAAWCAGAARSFGDPSAVVCQLFFRWQEDERPSEDLVCFMRDGELVVQLGPDLALPIPLEIGGPEVDDSGLISYGI